MEQRKQQLFYKCNGPGIYSVTVTDFCNNTTQDAIEVLPQNFSLTIDKDTPVICKGDAIELRANTGFYDYIWTPASTLSNATAAVTIASPGVNTVYTVTAKKFEDCQLNASVAITVKDCPETIFVPNSFTPNGDGVNDHFKPIAEGSFISYRFDVYNRYGEKLFSTTQKGKGWDGNYKAIAQLPCAYTWSLQYQFRNKKTVLKKGMVVLIR